MSLANLPQRHPLVMRVALFASRLATFISQHSVVSHQENKEYGQFYYLKRQKNV